MKTPPGGLVFDSYSIFAFFEDEAGAPEVSRLIQQLAAEGTRAQMSVINLGELYYITLRERGKEQAEMVVAQLDSLPITIAQADREITRKAAELKATKKMSYADCFAAALAIQTHATVVTGDKEFKEVESLVRIHWIA